MRVRVNAGKEEITHRKVRKEKNKERKSYDRFKKE